jgi:hypothetical protein
MALVRLALPLRQAQALVQLAEEADLDTFSSCEGSERWAAMMVEAGTRAIGAMHAAITVCERKNARAAARRKK